KVVQEELDALLEQQSTIENKMVALHRMGKYQTLNQFVVENTSWILIPSSSQLCPHPE
ncbi:hypothetical protein EK904_006141, partial [Melospiza melodia maxima]